MHAAEIHPFFELLDRLDAGHYFYTVSRQRADAIQVCVTFVGERTEIDVFADGHMEVARFLGTEQIIGGADEVW